MCVCEGPACIFVSGTSFSLTMRRPSAHLAAELYRLAKPPYDHSFSSQADGGTKTVSSDACLVTFTQGVLFAEFPEHNCQQKLTLQQTHTCTVFLLGRMLSCQVRNVVIRALHRIRHLGPPGCVSFPLH